MGEPPVAWDEVWAGRATIAPVPRPSTDGALSSTGLPLRNSAPDLRGRRFSTVSTAPMTTSLRQGLRMTQAVRAAGGSGMTRATRTASTAGRVGIA